MAVNGFQGWAGFPNGVATNDFEGVHPSFRRDEFIAKNPVGERGLRSVIGSA